jgi:hypothetical protein
MHTRILGRLTRERASPPRFLGGYESPGELFPSQPPSPSLLFHSTPPAHREILQFFCFARD